MASIERRGDSWRVVWRHDGRKQYTTWPTQAYADEARAIVEGHRGRITAERVYADMGVLDDDQDGTAAPTLRAWSQTWLSAKTRITPGTRAGYARQLEARVWPVLGDARIDRIRPSQIGQLLNALHDPDDDEPGLKSTTVTRYFTLLNAIFDAAVHEGLISANPCAHTDFVRDQTEHDDTGEPDQVRLTPAEYKTLLAAFDPADRPLVELLAGTGARWSEATALTVGHIVPADGATKPKVRIWRAWKRDGRGGWYLGTTKGRRRREVAVSDSLIRTLEPLTAGRAPGELLFTAPRGGPVHYSNFLQRRWHPALARAMRCPEHPPPPRGEPRTEPGRARCRDFGGTNDRGEPCGALAAAGWTRCRDHLGPAPDAVSDCDCPGVLRRRPTPHDLRHTHAAWLFSDPRVTPLAISRRLGHAQLSTTSEIYGDLMPVADDAMVAALDDALD